MDLVVGARRVIVTMTRRRSRGEPKVVAECTYPLTARAAADVVVTELCVFRFATAARADRAPRGGATEDVEPVTAARYTADLEADVEVSDDRR